MARTIKIFLSALLCAVCLCFCIGLSACGGAETDAGDELPQDAQTDDVEASDSEKNDGEDPADGEESDLPNSEEDGRESDGGGSAGRTTAVCSFALDGDGTGYVVTGVTAAGAVLDIPSEHDGLPVTAIAEYAFRDRDEIESVTIPETIESIGVYAFFNCHGITEIYYDAAVCADVPSTSNNCIFCSAGSGGDGIALTIGASVTRVPTYLFNPYNNYTYSPKITSITFEEGCPCESIGRYTFGYLPYVTEIEFPVGLRLIERNAFQYCSGLREITLPEGFESLGGYVFQGCTSLESIRVPASLTEIGNYCFNGDTALKTVNITDFGAWAGIDFGGSSANPLRFGADLYLNGEKMADTGALVLPEGTEKIGEYAFYGSGFDSVSIPSSVKSIGDNSFRNCYDVTEIYYDAADCGNLGSSNYVFAYAGRDGGGITVRIGTDVTRIPNRLFLPYTTNADYAPDIRFVLFDEESSCAAIGDYAFYRCAFAGISVPDSVKTIGSYAFGNCTSLERVVIGKGVEEIDSNAFRGCTALSAVFYAGTESGWESISIGDDNSPLTGADVYFYSETAPTKSGNWWHHDEDGKPVVW